MALSQGNVSLGPTGLTLLAWAVINGDTGAIIKGSNISAATHTGGTGLYAVTFTAAVPNANYIVTSEPSTRAGATAKASHSINTLTTAGFNLQTFNPGLGNADYQGPFHLQVWA